MLKVAVIGYGYWGPNLVRNFVEAPNAECHHGCGCTSLKPSAC